MKVSQLSKPIVLVGMMGAGKTFIGSRLAKEFDVDFIDTDHIIENSSSCSISEIFTTHGEQYFRDLEFEVIKTTLEKRGCVVAVGGGAYIYRRNQAIIDTIGISVWLEAKAEILWKRTAGKGNRPLLEKDNSLLKIRELLGRREKYYRKAVLSFRTDSNDSIETLVFQMRDQISKYTTAKH